jgi:hypothetical protein
VLGCLRVGAEEGNQETGRNCDLYSPNVRGDLIEGELGGACLTLGERRNSCRDMKAMSLVM